MNFIKSYMAYAAEFTDSPKMFHYRIALYVLSTVMNTRYWIRHGNINVYPNLWMILLAPSGVGKSFAMGIGKSIVNSVDQNLILPNEYSREKFVEIMAKNSVGNFFISEFSGFMEFNRKDYNRGIMQMLTELFDCPPVYTRQLQKGDKTIINPFLGILACSTVEWFIASVRSGDSTGGFLPRFLLTSIGDSDKVRAFMPEDNQSIKNQLVDQLAKIASQDGGKMTLSAEALKFYEDWHDEFHEKRKTKSETLRGFYTRLKDYTLKFSMILNINTGSGLVITKDSMHRACSLSKDFIDQAEDIIENEISSSKSDAEIKSVRKIVKREKEIARQDLVKKSKMKSKDLDVIIKTLIESAEIVTENCLKISDSGQEYSFILYRWIGK